MPKKRENRRLSKLDNSKTEPEGTACRKNLYPWANIENKTSDELLIIIDRLVLTADREIEDRRIKLANFRARSRELRSRAPGKGERQLKMLSDQSFSIKCLRFFLPKDVRDAAVGSLIEDYAGQSEHFGPVSLKIWLLKDVTMTLFNRLLDWWREKITPLSRRG